MQYVVMFGIAGLLTLAVAVGGQLFGGIFMAAYGAYAASRDPQQSSSVKLGSISWSGSPLLVIVVIGILLVIYALD